MKDKIYNVSAEQFQKMKAEFAALTNKFSQAYKDVAIDIAEAEIQEAITAVRKQCSTKLE